VEATTMSTECCDPDEGEAKRTCPLRDAVRKFAGDLRKAGVGEHIRGMHREALLVMRSLIDACLEQIEPSTPDESQAGPRTPAE
jgi:hypothetical protein